MSFLTSIFGKPLAGKAKPGTLIRDEEFVDLDFPIVEHRAGMGGTRTVVARAAIDGRVVGFAFDLASGWNEKILEEHGLTLYWGSGFIRSIGADSDALLSLLSDSYGFEASTAPMATRTAVTVVGLNSNPGDKAAKDVTMKVFFEPPEKAHYGEVFINLRLDRGVLEIHDKDPEYHHGIIASLTSRE